MPAKHLSHVVQMTNDTYEVNSFCLGSCCTRLGAKESVLLEIVEDLVVACLSRSLSHLFRMTDNTAKATNKIDCFVRSFWSPLEGMVSNCLETLAEGSRYVVCEAALLLR